MSVKVAHRSPEESEEDDEDEPADEVDEQVLRDPAVRVLERHDDGVVLHEVVAPQVQLEEERNPQSMRGQTGGEIMNFKSNLGSYVFYAM